MTIQELGSIGELVGAVATVATLVYLAVQIRANTTALHVETRRAELEGASAYTSAVIENADVARIFNAGLADPASLSIDDVTRFSFLLGQILGAEAGHFDEVLIGFAQNQSLDRRRQTVGRFIVTPGGRWFWKRYAGDYPSEFRVFIDQILRDADSAG
jgi:hypothetical protein